MTASQLGSFLCLTRKKTLSLYSVEETTAAERFRDTWSAFNFIWQNSASFSPQPLPPPYSPPSSFHPPPALSLSPPHPTPSSPPPSPLLLRRRYVVFRLWRSSFNNEAVCWQTVAFENRQYCNASVLNIAQIWWSTRPRCARYLWRPQRLKLWRATKVIGARLGPKFRQNYQRIIWMSIFVFNYTLCVQLLTRTGLMRGPSAVADSKLTKLLLYQPPVIKINN